MKKTFIIIGPESSGNRLMRHIFVESGCFNCDEPDIYPGGIRLLKNDIENVVMCRSIPNGNTWFNLECVQDIFQLSGFSVYFILLFRNWYPNIRSKCINNSVNECEAEESLVNECRHIFSYISKLENFYLFSTSALFLNPVNSMRDLISYTGLKINYISLSAIVMNPDSKHYEEIV